MSNDCPRDVILGRPMCHIVPHPDRPDESFCVNCPKRFVERNSASEWFWLLIVIMLIVILAPML